MAAITESSAPHAGAPTPGTPAFLVGPARSGTSMLYKLLCLHPEASYVSNYVRRLPMLPELAAFNRLGRAVPDVRRGSWFAGGNAYVYDKPRSFGQWAFPAPVEGEPVFRHCGFVEYDHEQPASPTVRASRMRRSIQRIQRAGGGSTFVNKRIANNRRIPELHAAFRHARFVSLVRDGRAVALSLSKVDWWEDGHVWFAGCTPREWAAQGRDPMELCARNWVEELDAIEAGLFDVPQEQVMHLRYEDFIAAPRMALEQIGAFIGLAPSVEWDFNLDRASFPNRNERWGSELEPRALELIESIQGPWLGRLGYLG